MSIFQEPVPLPPAPDVMRWTRDGRPLPVQVEYERRLTAWLDRLRTFVGTPGLSSMTPATATLAAAGAVNRILMNMLATGGVLPLTWSVDAAGGVAAAFRPGTNILATTAAPCGTVGAHAMTIRATDSLGATITGTLTVTLT